MHRGARSDAGPGGKRWGGDLVSTDVTCREAHLLFLTHKQSGVRSVRPQHPQPSGDPWEPHSPGPPATVLRQSPRPVRRPLRLRKERSESVIEQKRNHMKANLGNTLTSSHPPTRGGSHCPFTHPCPRPAAEGPALRAEGTRRPQPCPSSA